MADEAKLAQHDAEHLRLIYSELCAAHHGIADFRAKLLALLPVASGAGIFLLLGAEVPGLRAATTQIATGIIGALLVFGLYLYELRGIQRCNALSACSCKIEALMVPGLPGHGAFSAEPGRVAMATNTNAAIVIYATMLASWAFVSADGFAGEVGMVWVALGVPVLVFVLAVLFGRRFIKMADKAGAVDVG